VEWPKESEEVVEGMVENVTMIIVEAAEATMIDMGPGGPMTTTTMTTGATLVPLVVTVGPLHPMAGVAVVTDMADIPPGDLLITTLMVLQFMIHMGRVQLAEPLLLVASGCRGDAVILI